MKTNLIFTILLLLGIAYGCSDQINQDDLKGQSGKVIIKLTDAPFPTNRVDSVLVDIDWIKLKSNSSDSTGESPFTMINVDTTVNLLDLSNGISMVLGELDHVPEGMYSEIRMRVTGATVVYDGDKRDDIKIPSGSTSGLKIKISPALEVGGFNPAVVLIDFDASRSFLVKGNPFNKGNSKQEITGFKFKPVLRAVPLDHTGEVSGIVKDTIAGDTTGADAVVLQGAQLNLIFEGSTPPDTISALTDEEGKYRIIGVPKGDYILSCSKDTLHNTWTEDVSIIENGDVVTQDFILTKQVE